MNYSRSNTRTIVVGNDTDRYFLGKYWDFKKPSVTIVLYNPTYISNYIVVDSTINKCLVNMHRMGFGIVRFVNLFSEKCNEQKELSVSSRVTDQTNNCYIEWAVEKSTIVLVAWGDKGGRTVKDKKVIDLLRRYSDKLVCFKHTSKGKPIHPGRAVSYKEGVCKYSFE